MIDAAKRLLHEYGQDRIGQLSAAFSYFTIFAIGPVLLVIVSVAGAILGEDAVNGQLAEQLSSTFGAETAKTLQDVVANSYQAGHSGIGLTIGIIGLILAASGLFGQLRTSFNQIFKVEPDPKAKIYSLLWPRLKGILLLGLVSVFVLASIAASTLISALAGQAQAELGGPSWGLEILNFFVSAAIIGLLLGLLYRVVPDVVVPRRVALISGLIIGLLFSVGKTILGLVIGNNGTANAYGAAASLIVLLLWVFYFGQIVFAGAEGIKLYAQSRGIVLGPKKNHLKQKSLEANLSQPAAGLVEAFQRGYERSSRK